MIETNELKGKISSDNKIQGRNTAISGPQGKEGLSAYEVAVKNGYIGSEEEWLKTLKGEKGDQGEQGIQGDVSLKQLNELQTKTIKCLQEVETPTPVSGENIDIVDSAEAKITELNIRGNSVQKIREGYNELLNTAKKYTTDKGIIATFEEDGTIIVSGTATGTVDIQLCGVWASTKVQFSLKAGNYKYTSNNSGLKLYLANNTSAIYFSDNEVKALEDYSVTNAFIRIENGVTINSTIKPMLYLYQGTEREYEQYGASPSPEYSSEVESCGDNVNLFDGAFRQGNASSITDTKNVFNNNNFVLKKGNYSFSTNLPTTFKWAIFGSNQEFPNSNSVSFNSSFKTLSTYNFTFNDDYYIGIMITKVDGNEITPNELNKYYFKIEKGTKATPYSPYGQGCINEVICNKNILDLTEFNGVTSNGLTSKVADDGKVTITGTLSSAVNTHLRLPYIFTKSMLGKTLTLSTSGTTNFNLENITNIGFKEANTSINNNTYINPTKLKTTFEVTEDVINRVTNLDFYFVSTITNVNISFYLQLEEGSTATDYIEHQSQIYTIPTQQPMRSKKDTFIKKNNKWFERHYGNRYIFTGTENVSLQNSGKRIYVPQSKNANMEKPIGSLNSSVLINIYKMSCNYLTQKSAGKTWDGVQGVAYDYNANTVSYGFDIAINAFTTAQEYLDWFKEKYDEGNPFYIDYVLAEPNDIECTEEQSTILWDIEQNAKTYKNITHIFSTDNVSPNIELTYKKDIETIFAKTLVEGV